MAVSSKRFFSFWVIRYDTGLTEFLMLYFFGVSIISFALYHQSTLSVDAIKAVLEILVIVMGIHPASKLSI